MPFWSVKDRGRLAKMLKTLFDHWDLNNQDRANLLGVPEFDGDIPLEDDEETLAGAGILLRIHKSLRTIFPQNIDLAYLWVTSPSRQFHGNTPLSLMRQGKTGLQFVRHYLEQECER